MNTHVPDGYADTVPWMRRDHESILLALAGAGLTADAYPERLPTGNPQGVAAARAFPIQGVLKYHGMTDWNWRTTFLPSISLNNDAAQTLTYVSFDPGLEDDLVTIGGNIVQGRERERVLRTLDIVREIGRISSRASVISRNISRATHTGKGLGTSASASAALATAALGAVFGDTVTHNHRFVSCIARLLAGSGCRSAVGGVSLWLSYPGIAHEDSYAIRLDDRDQLSEMALVTVPIDSRMGLKTELAHRDAPHSPFYKSWMQSRHDEVIECLEAAQSGDWRTIGQLAELDSIRLHGVTMSASRENKIFAWEAENISLFRMCNALRSDGVPVYFSTDTGPTVVFITHQKYVPDVLQAINDLQMGLEAIPGRVAGPAKMVPNEDALQELDIK